MYSGPGVRQVRIIHIDVEEVESDWKINKKDRAGKEEQLEKPSGTEAGPGAR
jgi:hypothetical protein